ncbi:hypothetical protein [Lysinibacillus pakistanensis]|uniref:Uncharacterized protein n=1 Tax=Lysinibacillus pakistanensis TaxID=759811 RepID=A0ABX6DAY9_9BACI|nr:hypothetical protein GDS87_06810 [Lysinibacillus pakistanensis]
MAEVKTKILEFNDLYDKQDKVNTYLDYLREGTFIEFSTAIYSNNTKV